MHTCMRVCHVNAWACVLSKFCGVLGVFELNSLHESSFWQGLYKESCMRAMATMKLCNHAPESSTES